MLTRRTRRIAATGQGKQPPDDPYLVFRALFLQAPCALSDEAAGFQILERPSFQPFLVLDLVGSVPTAKTVCLRRDHLVKAAAITRLFTRFDAELTERDYVAKGV